MTWPHPIDVSSAELNGRTSVTVRAGLFGVERIVPPAGEAYAFEVPQYRHTFQIYSSATGRSVRLWIDGEEVEL